MCMDKDEVKEFNWSFSLQIVGKNNWKSALFIANCRQKYWKSGMQQSNELTNNSVIVKHVIPTTH